MDFKNKKFLISLCVILLVMFAVVGGAVGAFLMTLYLENQSNAETTVIQGDTIVKNNYIPQTTEEEKIIEAVKQTVPAVVSIVITEEVPVYEKYYIDPFGFGDEFLIPQYRKKGTEKKQVGGGTGFIVSEQGMILTNKHVLVEKEAEYTVFSSSGESYPVEILAKDPFYDLALIKIVIMKTRYFQQLSLAILQSFR